MSNNPIKVFTKKQDDLSRYLKDNYTTQAVYKLSFWQKLFAKQENPDIFIYNTRLDESDKEIVQRSKKVLVNSYHAKSNLQKSCTQVDLDIEVVYPMVSYEKFKKKPYKKALLKSLDLQKQKPRTILFHGTDLKKQGLVSVLNICQNLQNKNFILFISSTQDEIYKAKFTINKYKQLLPHIFYFDESQDKQTLFRCADIFVLPTTKKSFALDVVFAMSAKCAIFVTQSNHASELLDVFASLSSPDDATATFKVDALLGSKDELKKIQKQNFKQVKYLSTPVIQKQIETIVGTL